MAERPLRYVFGVVACFECSTRRAVIGLLNLLFGKTKRSFLLLKRSLTTPQRCTPVYFFFFVKREGYPKTRPVRASYAKNVGFFFSLIFSDSSTSRTHLIEKLYEMSENKKKRSRTHFWFSKKKSY